MIREKGGEEVDSPLGSLRPPARNPSADYYALSGWQSQSPSGRLDLEALPSRMLASVPPLSKSPFSTGSLSRHPVLSPERTYSSAMDSSLDRDTALYSRGSLAAGYRGSADLGYNGEQPPHPPPPPLSMAPYHSSKDGGYLGLTCPDSSGGTVYGRSVLENTLFSRGLSMASLPNNPNLVPNYRSHLGSSGEDFSMEHPLERKFVFGSSHTPSPLLSSHPYNRLLENYSHSAEHVSSAVKSNFESSAVERSGAHYTSPLPSHVAFSTGASYISRNPPLYPFSHLSSSFAPENYTSYASSLSHLSSYGQLSAPPPAHSRAHDTLSQRPSFAQEEPKQAVEGSVGQPFDATMSRDFTVPNAQWNHANISESKRESNMAPFEGQAQSSDAPVTDNRQCDCYQDTQALPLPKEEDALEKLMDSQFVAVGSQEKVVSVQSESSNQSSRRNPCQMDTSWNMTDVRYTQSTAALSSMNGASSPPVVNINTNERPVQQQTTYNMNSSQNAASTFLPCQGQAVFPTKFTSSASTTSCSYTPSQNNTSISQFPQQSSLYSGSIDSDGGSDLGGKLQHSTSQAEHKDNRYISMSSNTEQQQKEGRYPYTLTGKSAPKTSHTEALQYESSTSEYEPPSPPRVSVKSRKRGRKPEVTVRRRTITTSFQDDSDDTLVDLHSSKIKLTIKTEKIMAESSENVTAVQKSRKVTVRRKRKKKSVTENKVKAEGRLNNRTCPLCLKTFSRADSLTCHMRVHTGDRPYHCDQCAASYKVSSHLRDHIRSKHSDAKPFECEKCGKPFTYSTARRRHEKICGKDLAERVEFQCASCHKGFVTEKGFSKHQEKCGVVRPGDDGLKGERITHKCKNCHKVFDSLLSLDGHQRFFCGKTKNLQVGHFSCGECGKAFFKRNLYMIHMRHHAGGKPFRCRHCEGCFSGKGSLKQHMERHKTNSKFRCTLCDAAFFVKRCLTLHVSRVHGLPKSYKCKECEWDFSSGYHLCQHLRTVHRQVKQFKYALVGKEVSGASIWTRHRRWRPFQPNRPVQGQMTQHHTCSFCKKSFTMLDMRPHISSEHPGVTLSEALNKRPARCGHCSKGFSCQETLHVHRLRHRGRRPFHCNHCNMAFLLKSVLRSHQRKHDDCQPYSCPECGKTFRWHASVRQHRISHHGHRAEGGEQDNTRFTCNVCGMHFKQQIFLNVHMKGHSIVAPNLCTVCGKGFVDLRHLKLHMSRHDGPKTFVCEKCGAAFSTQHLLESHIKRSHTERPKRAWLCEECGKSLGRRDSLQKHMALHAKYHSGLIPRAGPRKGIKRTNKRREWRKNDAMYELPSSATANATVYPGTVMEREDHTKFAVPTTRVHELSEADLVELRPANFIPPNLGTSPSLGVLPSFAAASRFGATPSFAVPPGVGPPQPTEEQYNYQYNYNTYINHNIPCPTAANQ